MITDDYEVFCNTYHKGLIKENEKLKEENEKLEKYANIISDINENLNVDIIDYKDEIEDYKETIEELKGENKELQEFKEQAEDECSNSAVFEKMIDEIRELEGELEILKEKHQLKCKNLKRLKEYTKSKNEWIYEDDPDTLKELNDNIDNDY